MATKIKLDSKTARLKLAVREKPYFTQVAPGVSLGYRRNLSAGAWSVRGADGRGGNWMKKFALADDAENANGETVLSFAQAIDKARLLGRGKDAEAPNADRPMTVADAVEAYAASLVSRGKNAANAKHIRYNTQDWPAYHQPVSMLTAAEMTKWRNGLVVGRVVFEDGKRVEVEGLKPSGANRVANVLRAALYLASRHDDRIGNTNAWKHGLAKLSDSTTARNIILPDPVVAEIVRRSYAISHKFGLLIDTLAETGARESQLMRVEVQDLLDGASPRLMVPNSRKGSNGDKANLRKALPISSRLAKILRKWAEGRPGSARLLPAIDKPWKDFRVVVAEIGADPEATPYSLRHSSIVRQLLAGIPTRVVASHHDTSVLMIEQHYSAKITDAVDDRIRAALIDHGPALRAVA